jgi:hypothetical protein
VSLLLALATAAALPAGLPKDLEAMVRSFYADVARADNPDPLWQMALVPSVRALERQVETTVEGVPDYLDGDWLCQCQDPAGLKITSLAGAPGPGGTTEVTVRFGFGGPRKETVKLVMVRSGAKWKIADLIDKTGMRYTYALRYNLKPHRH